MGREFQLTFGALLQARCTEPGGGNEVSGKAGRHSHGLSTSIFRGLCAVHLYTVCASENFKQTKQLSSENEP